MNRLTMRAIQAIIIWLVLLGWGAFAVYAVERLGIDVYQGIGLGAVIGVLLKMLSDMWQFYFRKKEGG